FQVDPKDRTFRATRPGDDPAAGGVVDKSPWYWASMDNDRRVLFTYLPDREVYDMPIYSPGVIDARNWNNPVTLGGFDAAPQGAFEARPPRDQDEFLGSVYGRTEEGKPDPEGRLQTKQPDRTKWKGWITPMMYAADEGIDMGVNELNYRINASGRSQTDIDNL